VGAEVAGLEIMDMPDGVTPLSALVIFKALDPDGNLFYFAKATPGLMTVEALGMARFADHLLLFEQDDGEEG
jgi:hypothetical protein